MLENLMQKAGAAGIVLAGAALVAVLFFGFNRVNEYEVGVRRNPSRDSDGLLLRIR